MEKKILIVGHGPIAEATAAGLNAMVNKMHDDMVVVQKDIDKGTITMHPGKPYDYDWGKLEPFSGERIPITAMPECNTHVVQSGKQSRRERRKQQRKNNKR